MSYLKEDQFLACRTFTRKRRTGIYSILIRASIIEMMSGDRRGDEEEKPISRGVRFVAYNMSNKGSSKGYVMNIWFKYGSDEMPDPKQMKEIGSKGADFIASREGYGKMPDRLAEFIKEEFGIRAWPGRGRSGE